MSNTLLPCPFCGGEATISDGGYSGEKFFAHCRDLSCPAASGFIRKTHDEAIAAWNRRAQPSEKPLTLDELQGIDGESVRIEESNLWYGGNGVVSLAKGGVIDPDDPNGCWPFENYGEWLAYRSKPKEEANG